MKLASQIRELAEIEFVQPAVKSGKVDFEISVKDLMGKAEEKGVVTMQRIPAFCAAIRTQGFLRDNSLEITRQDGPESKISSTLVIHYRHHRSPAPTSSTSKETPEQRAFRLTEKLRGLMKDEIAVHGGAEGYLRWVRGEDEEGAE